MNFQYVSFSKTILVIKNCSFSTVVMLLEGSLSSNEDIDRLHLLKTGKFKSQCYV